MTNDPSKVSFESFGLNPKLLQAVQNSGYTVATPIQAQAIPAILQGRDVMGAAQTGTGKTAAFTLPVLNLLLPFASSSTSPARHPVRALVLVPTRELADQVAQNVRNYSEFTDIRSTLVYGGVDIKPQKAELLQGCELLIATPGRLLDHLSQNSVRLSQVSMLVLDEADRMLDMGFMPDIEKIMRSLPVHRQTLLFSATFSGEIKKLARTILRQPLEISVAADNKISDHVKQSAYRMDDESKKAALLYLLKSRFTEQVIVFSNTKSDVNQLSYFLIREGIRAQAIHGDKSQFERTRTFDQFKAGDLQVLVATDVAARGLDVAHLPAVINYDLPSNPEDYVHRIGRTGRAGGHGEAVALIGGENDENNLEQIQKLTGSKIPVESLSIPDVFLQHGQERKVNRWGRSSGGRSQAIDGFFYKPYEPEKKNAKAPVKQSMSQILDIHRQQEESRRDHGIRAVLLGGSGKRED